MNVFNKQTVGILALQGSFAEHADMVRQLGYEVRLIRNPEDTEGISACILPGGESTTLMKLLKKTGLDGWLKESAQKGLPIYGTCAGMIVLGQLGLIDIETQRNAYGPQLSSFETSVNFQGKAFLGIFIRAPKVIKVSDSVEVLAGSFHPELTQDSRIHEFFLRNF